VNFLKLDSSVWVSSRATIGENFISHFTNIFTSSNPYTENEMLDLFSSVITEEENETLSTPLAEEEILEALTSLGSTKATELDRFTVLFYKKYWNLIKNDVLLCIGQFSSTIGCREARITPSLL
jgi:hypothetical protein